MNDGFWMMDYRLWILNYRFCSFTCLPMIKKQRSVRQGACSEKCIKSVSLQRQSKLPACRQAGATTI